MYKIYRRYGFIKKCSVGENLHYVFHKLLSKGQERERVYFYFKYRNIPAESQRYYDQTKQSYYLYNIS